MSLYGPKIGDEIIVTVPKENRDWGYDPCRDGSKGKIIEFGETYEGRTGSYNLPGVYHNKYWFVILLESGKKVNLGSHCVDYLDPNLDTIRLKEVQEEIRTKTSRQLDKEKFVRPLPETDCYEGDIIRILGEGYRDMKGQEYRIVSLNYHYIDTFCNDNVTEKPIYDFATRFPNDEGVLFECGTCSVNRKNSELVSHGNVWKYHHGEELSFNSEEEEIKFWCSLSGLKDEVKNPITGDYNWRNIDHFKKALYDDIIDGRESSTFRFVDRSIGEKVRQYMIKNFKFNE